MYTPDCVDVNLCDFSVLVEKDYYFDKTNLICDIFHEEKNLKILMTAPPGSGKTAILSMLKAFLEIQVDERGAIIDREISKNRKLFYKRQLMITNQNDLFHKHFAKYPVLSITFKDFIGIYSVEDILKKLNSVLDGLLRLHSYLNDSDNLSASEKDTLLTYRRMVDIGNSCDDEIAEAFAFLKQCLFKHFDKKKVFVFIDDCDTPLFNSRHNIKTIKIEEDVNKILYKILSKLIDDDKEFLMGCIIAGIYKVDYQKYIPEPSSTTIFKKIRFQDCTTIFPYFGLVEPQVDFILASHNVDRETIQTIKRFYAGFYNKFGRKCFCQWSIISYLQFGQLKSYWLESNRVDSGAESIEILYALEKLMVNIPYKLKYKKLIANLDYKNFDFFDYLLHLGYLTFTPVARGNTHLNIPTQNIRNRICMEELDIFSQSSKHISRCASILYKIKYITVDRTYRQFIIALKQTFNAYNVSLLVKHNEYYFFIVFIIAVKLKWLVGDTYSLARPSPDSLIIRNNNIIISLIVCCNFLCPLRGLEKIRNASIVHRLMDNPDQVYQRISIAININTVVSVSLAVMNGTGSLENARFIVL